MCEKFSLKNHFEGSPKTTYSYQIKSIFSFQKIRSRYVSYFRLVCDTFFPGTDKMPLIAYRLPDILIFLCPSWYLFVSISRLIVLGLSFSVFVFLFFSIFLIHLLFVCLFFSYIDFFARSCCFFFTSYSVLDFHFFILIP